MSPSVPPPLLLCRLRGTPTAAFAPPDASPSPPFSMPLPEVDGLCPENRAVFHFVFTAMQLLFQRKQTFFLCLPQKCQGNLRRIPPAPPPREFPFVPRIMQATPFPSGSAFVSESNALRPTVQLLFVRMPGGIIACRHWFSVQK